MIIRYRKYLPHLESPDSTYFVTFRLADSLPKSVLEDLRFEKETFRKKIESQNRELSKYEKERFQYLYSDKIEKYLDKMHGHCWLKNPEIAQLVVNALLHFDGDRYNLHAWCVMPNHVHVVFTVISKGGILDSDLIPILHSWKSYTAHKANKILKREGKFWMDEYYDHLIKSEDEFSDCINYTLQNPVKANFCEEWQQWKWSGCSKEIIDQFNQDLAGGTPASPL